MNTPADGIEKGETIKGISNLKLPLVVAVALTVNQAYGILANNNTSISDEDKAIAIEYKKDNSKSDFIEIDGKNYKIVGDTFSYPSSNEIDSNKQDKTQKIEDKKKVKLI